MPPMMHSKTSIRPGSSALSLASGQSSFGRCVTKVGWMSVGSIFLPKISLTISCVSQPGWISRPSFDAAAVAFAL
jgi:hypothetical protein